MSDNMPESSLVVDFSNQTHTIDTHKNNTNTDGENITFDIESLLSFDSMPPTTKQNTSWGIIKTGISKALKKTKQKNSSEEDLSKIIFKCTTDADMENMLGNTYIDTSNNRISSNSLDVLALYIKGQKLLYTEAKTYCEQQLNFLMLPAIFISCVGSIFSFISEKYSYGPIIIASMNGFNAFLLALISYLKLDAKAQAHKTSAYKFDRLESYCEFNSGKLLFLNTNTTDIVKVVEKIETDVKEIKETNQFILPEYIRYEFHYTYSTNIFTMVKRMHSREMEALHNLKNCIHQIAALKSQLESVKQNLHSVSSIAGGSIKTQHEQRPLAKKDVIIQKLTDTIHTEERRRNILVDSILAFRKEYYHLDSKFNEEIEKHMKRVNQAFISRVFCCDWLKS